MNKKIGTIIGLILVAAGAVLMYFVHFTTAQITAFAVIMFGAGLACSNMYSSASEKNWKTILSIVFIGAGSFITGFFNIVTSDTVVSVITMVIGIVVIIAGIVVSVIANKNSETQK